jgi:hypothetical protein
MTAPEKKTMKSWYQRAVNLFGEKAAQRIIFDFLLRKRLFAEELSFDSSQLDSRNS